ncbi:MAG: type II toxin-antitoxin system VapC family toxin [Bryobacteraceae bacterium]
MRDIASKGDGLYSCAWCVAEMACVLHRKIREQVIDAREGAIMRSQFLNDVRTGVWSLLPVTEHLLYEVDNFIASLSSSVFLRAGDAVHLIAAQRAGFTEIWTNDRHLGRAAEHAGLTAKAI